MASASGYNHHRFARSVLKKSRKWEPSLTVQLYPSYWKFADSPNNFPYDGPLRPFLLALRSQVIPAALMPFLYDIQPPVSFVDGCLVVELQDFRRVPEVRSRVVMRPAAESLAQTIDCMLERKGEGWDERLALELESRIISATSPPLYLGTSILATRNAVLSMTLTSPATPHLSADGHLRRTVPLPETSTSSSDRMRKLLRASERLRPATALGFAPNWSILRLKERMAAMERQQAAERDARVAAQNQAQSGLNGGWAGMDGSGEGVGQSGGIGGAAHLGAGDDPPKKKKKKRAAAAEDDDEEDEAPKAPAAKAPVKKKKPAAAGGAGAKANESPEKGKGGAAAGGGGGVGGKSVPMKSKAKAAGAGKEDEAEKPKKKPKKKVVKPEDE